MIKIKKKGRNTGKTAGKSGRQEKQEQFVSSAESTDESAGDDGDFSNFASQEEERRKINQVKGRKLRIIIAVSVFVILMFFAAAMVYIFTADNDNTKFTYNQPSTEVRIIQTQTTQNPAAGNGSGQAGQNFWRPMGQPVNFSAIQEANITRCNTWETYEDVCKADNGCQGTIKMNCISGKWKYGNCTTIYSMCSDNMCRVDCRDEKQKYAEKYSLTDQSIVFFYMNEPHSNAMLPFMRTMSSTYLLENGKDIWFESYLGLRGTIPAVVCFNNKAILVGEHTRAEVEDFRLRNC